MGPFIAYKMLEIVPAVFVSLACACVCTVGPTWSTRGVLCDSTGGFAAGAAVCGDIARALDVGAGCPAARDGYLRMVDAAVRVALEPEEPIVV